MREDEYEPYIKALSKGFICEYLPYFNQDRSFKAKVKVKDNYVYIIDVTDSEDESSGFVHAKFHVKETFGVVMGI